MTSKPIVVAVDGGRASLEAVRWAAAYAGLHHIPLEICHVVRDPLLTTAPGMGPAPVVIPASVLEDAATSVLDEAATVARESGFDAAVTTQALHGPVAKTLVDVSAAAATMVLGASRHGQLTHAIFGSVAGHVLRHAQSPVVVVPVAGTAPHGDVVVGVDGSHASIEAVRFAFDEASWRQLGLTAIHALALDELDETTVRGGWVPTPGEVERAVQEATVLVHEALADWHEKHPDVAVTVMINKSAAIPALLSASRTATLVVVGSHGRGVFGGMLLGSVSEGVAKASPTPVAIVRP